MSGPTPDPAQLPHDPEAASRLHLARAVRRATWAIAWERSWPHLARLLTVAGLFLVASWAGLWLWLPVLGRAIGLGLFVMLTLAALAPLVKFRWPSRGEALSRLDHGSGIRHRPATALSDTLASTDPVTQALWQVQRQRTLAALASIRAGLPSPRLARHDPWALRALVALTLVATFIAAGEERRARIAAAFDWNGVLAPANIRVDAWVAPPLYTNKPPIILDRAEGRRAGRSRRGAGGARGLDPDRARQRRHARRRGHRPDHRGRAHRPAPNGTSERHFAIAGDGTAHVRAPSGLPTWSFAASADRPPSIALAKDPERLARGSLQLSYKLEDDYGVTEAHARFSARATEGGKGADKGKAPRRGRCSSRRNSRWCCRMPAPATVSARP